MSYPNLNSTGCALRYEETVREKRDDNGNLWSKVYFGNGAHFKNWLDQVLELYGEENVEVEAVAGTDLKCFNDAKEPAYRIWVRRKR